MTIIIKKDRIEFDDFILSETPQGLSLNAQITASALQDTYQGTVAGFVSGGAVTPTTKFCIIERFPFTSDSTAINVGNLSQAREDHASQSSATHGYSSGGFCPVRATIDRFPFSSCGVATSVGSLTIARYVMQGQSSYTHGYTAGGYTLPGCVNRIDKFPFANDIDASIVGGLCFNNYGPAGNSSCSHGYSSGGYRVGLSVQSFMEKFSFTTDGSASSVGNLNTARYVSDGNSSNFCGFVSGGEAPAGGVCSIERFPFASDSTVSCIGNLCRAGGNLAVSDSIDNAYLISGCLIERFPFSSPACMYSVASLTCCRYRPGGNQD